MTIKPKNGGMEYRYDRGGPPKLADGKLSGRAAPFDKPTMIGKKPWGFRETIAKGCFMKSIKDGDVVLLDNHDSARPISRQSADTLVMAETRGGLDWDAIPANTSYANDVRENAAAGNYGGCSFGFEVVRDSWHYNKEEDVDERTLLEVKLHEISVCTFPAYADGTSVTARDMIGAALEARDRFYFQEYGAHLEEDVPEDRASPPKPYGNVKYADPKNGKYPIDTKAHCKAAWSYVNMPKNAAKYPLNGVSLSSVKSRIKTACKKFGMKISTNEAAIDSENPDLKATAKMGLRKDSVKLTGGRKLVAKIRQIAFDDSRSGEDGEHRQLAEIRNLILNDLIKRSNTPAVKGAGNNGTGTGAFNDKDSDDMLCPTCNGAGMLSDGVTRCPGGCGGTGYQQGFGDNTAPGSVGSGGGDAAGAMQDAGWGLGLLPASTAQGNNPPGGKSGGSGTPVAATGTYGSNTPTNSGNGNPPGLPGGPTGAPGGGAGVQATGTYSKKVKGEKRKNKQLSGEQNPENGQPDTSTDPEGDADVARRMRAVARGAQMRRELADAEARK